MCSQYHRGQTFSYWVYRSIPPKTQEKVGKIINSRRNLAPIPGGVNISKGARVKNTILGSKWTPRPDRDRYIKQAHPQARRVAQRLDKAYKKVSSACAWISGARIIDPIV